MRIHYITPYATDGNIGKAYNEACAQIQNPDDWIVIRDGDTMFLTPEWGRLIEQVLQEHGDKYDLLGAMTNRVNDSHQKVEGVFAEMDMQKHYEIAKKLQDEKGTEVRHTRFDLAGFFMAFRKRTWGAVRFEENTPLFDRMFSRRIARKGVMEGLYVLHAYRLWSEDPTQATEHLYK